MLFTEFPLDERLQRALVTAGFVTPTPIQAEAIPVAMAGRDLVGTAQTGTGKTAAFVLPILQRLIATPLEFRKTRAVILAPTRELVEQILAVVRELGVHTNVRAVAIYGGVPMHPQTRALRNGVELVVACPGRLLDHMQRRNTDFRQVDCLVLDEADRMLDMGFMPTIQEIIDYLPTERQTLLFSATFARTLNAFVKQTLRDPVRVEVDTAVAAQTVRHSLYQVKSSMKLALLTKLLRQLIPDSDSVLIFTKTRVTANQVSEHLYAEGMHADVLHAEKTQRARQDTLNQFRSGVFPYLVATDIAARGIDVTSISHVINYDLPARPDDYLHRIGRTGRMERIGYAISLLTRADLRSLRDIERMLGKRIEVAQLKGDDQQQMSDDILAQHDGMARAPKHHETTRDTHRPLKAHHAGEDERPRRTSRNVTPVVPSQRTERPGRTRYADAPPPRSERPRPSYQPDTAPAAPARAERPSTRRGDAVPYPRAARPQYAPYTEAPPSRNERPRRSYQPDAASSAAPARAARPERPQRAPFGDTPESRKDRRRKQFATDAPTAERTPRPVRPERQRRDGEASTPPKRRDHAAAETRFADTAPSGAPRPQRNSGKPFTGMASAAKYQRKHAVGKRQPGEVAASPRPRGRA